MGLLDSTWKVGGGFAIPLMLRWFGNSAISRMFDRVGQKGASARLARRRKLVVSGSLETWVVKQGLVLNSQHDLATFEHNDACRNLPILAPKEWLSSGSPIRVSEHHLVAIQTMKREVEPAIPKVIARREAKFGQRIWNGESLAFTALPKSYGEEVRVRTAGYFDIAKPMIELENEAFRRSGTRLALSAPLSRAPLQTDRPIGMGGTAIFVVDDGVDGPSTLIHRRSMEVATMPGIWCTTPTYIFEDPMAGGRDPSRLDAITWNVVREVLEEVFGHEDVSRSSRRSNADWFLDETDQGRNISDLLDSGHLSLFHLGWSQNLLNGLVDVMTLVYLVGDSTVINSVRKQVSGSKSEVDDQIGSIRWIPLFSEELSKMCAKPTFHATGALTVKLAREYLAKQFPLARIRK
jgi:hypothetical protein